ncbi:MAG: hypothetical protein GX100_05490 [candidate division WS1 bacterium]|nr:hypothetical protein [candidate division WS1 bacterium]
MRKKGLAMMLKGIVMGLLVGLLSASSCPLSQSQQPTYAATSEEVKSVIARDLGLDIARLTVKDIPPLPNGSTDQLPLYAISLQQAESEKTERGVVSLDREQSHVQTIAWDRYPVHTAEDCGLTRAQEVAEAYCRKLLGSWPPGMDLQTSRMTRKGVYTFRWVEVTDSGAETGKAASCDISADGLVLTCGVTGRETPHSQDEVRVTKEEAIGIAEGHIASKFAETVFSNVNARLILNYDFKPDKGPVWIVDFDSAPSQEAQPRLRVLRIDAVTGSRLDDSQGPKMEQDKGVPGN